MIIFHILSLCFVAWTIFLSEREALAWFREEKETLDKEKLQKYHRRMWVGLVFMIATGSVLFWPDRDILPSIHAFQLKMFFVFCLLLNAFVLGKLMPIAAARSYKSLSRKEKMPLMVSGGISLLCWLGAFISAFFLL
jgi:hypothetical protein